MTDVSVKYLKNFKMQLVCKNDHILKFFMDYLRTEKESTRIIQIPGRKIFKRTKTYPKLYKKNKEKIIFGRGLSDYLSYSLKDAVRQYEVNLILDYQEPFPLEIDQKWIDIFLNNPKGLDRGQMQIDDFNRMVRNNTGIAELFTGYGKTELLLSIADCSRTRTVIQVPDNGILEEVISRSQKYGVDVGNCDWTKQINVINVSGFMRSKRFDDQAKKWLKDVKLSIGDECHHFSSNSNKKFFDLLDSLERSYGFSASTDVKQGKKVKSHSVSLLEMGPKTSAVVQLCGPVRVDRASKIPMTLVRVETHVADASKVAEKTDWSNRLDQTIVSENLSNVFSKIFELDKTKMFFIPIHKKESGGTLYQNLLNLGYKGILWTSEDYMVNDKNVKCDNILKHLKQEMTKHSFDFIMSTKMEGIDLPPTLNAIIPLVGVNYRMIVQPIGRSARGDNVTVYLIYDRNNKITIDQANDRLRTIKSEYIIESNTKILIEPDTNQ